jgi:hypothetical protein
VTTKPIKLTTPQIMFLQRCDESKNEHAVAGYKPAEKLLDLGMIELLPGANSRYRPTKLGRKFILDNDL